MKALTAAIGRWLRGPTMTGLLKRCGIDVRRYWILMDLFGALSDRREMFNQLGRDGMELKRASWLYFLLSAVFSLIFVAMQGSVWTHFLTFQAITAFLLTSVLISETGNSLVNPAEGMVMAHQPVDGATYIAAKLSHLMRILLYFVPGLNVVPALAGLFLPNGPWFYPVVHLASAFAVGIVIALSCCALFGWLIRLVPPRRLKSFGQMAEMMPWLLYLCTQFSRSFRKHIRIPHWWPESALARGLIVGGLVVLAAFAIVMGIRALSGDYLARVAAIAQGRTGGRGKLRRSRFGAVVAWLGGGPASRAGYEFLSRMMLRDWQFRRQLIPLIPMVLAPLAGVVSEGRPASPFGPKFSFAHVVPHLFGAAFFFICPTLKQGSDYKGAWLFLLAPSGALARFARGVYWRLWFSGIGIPHVLILSGAVWFWGVRDGLLFTAFSLAMASMYLAMELRMIEGLPFSAAPEVSRNSYMVFLMFAGGLAMALVVGIQYFLIFHSVAAVAVCTGLLSIGAVLLTRNSLESFTVTMRFQLGLLTNEVKQFATEIE